MSSAGARLEALRLTKRYGRRMALDALDLTVTGPGITGLVGPNAAGKSTLIRTWMGFERPTSGEVRVNGVDPLRNRRRVLSAVAYVPQAPALYDALTVRDHLVMAESLRPGFSRDVAGRRLEQLAIPLDAGPKELSGGQVAQVVLSIALGARSDLLLLDEPLSDLDPLARREFLDLVAEAAAEGRTVLLSSHIVTDIERVCDSIIVLGIGRVLLHATIRAALDSHVMAADGARQAGTVALVPTESEGALALVRISEPAAMPGSRRATLDEIVLGYLAAARADPGVAL